MRRELAPDGLRHGSRWLVFKTASRMSAQLVAVVFLGLALGTLCGSHLLISFFLSLPQVSLHGRTWPQSAHTHTKSCLQPGQSTLGANSIPESLPASSREIREIHCRVHDLACQRLVLSES